MTIIGKGVGNAISAIVGRGAAGGSGGGGTSPETISGLYSWLDATDLTTMWVENTKVTQVSSPGDTVGYWADKSGNGHDYKQTNYATKAPLYSESFNTSYPSLDFQPARLGGLSNSGAHTHAASDWTIFAVTNNRAATAGAETYLYDQFAFRMLIMRTSAGIAFHDGVTSAGTPHMGTDPTILTAVLDSSTPTSATIHLNRVQSVAADFTKIGTGFPYDRAIGSVYNFSVAYWDGYISSLIFYDTVLSPTEIAGVEDYLADRYGITLP